jgi:hypothetical protein
MNLFYTRAIFCWYSYSSVWGSQMILLIDATIDLFFIYFLPALNELIN